MQDADNIIIQQWLGGKPPELQEGYRILFQFPMLLPPFAFSPELL